MAFDARSLQVGRGAAVVMIPSREPDSLKQILSIDPTNFFYSIEEICSLCNKYISSVPPDEGTAIRKVAISTVLSGTELRIASISMEQFFESLSFIQKICPFDQLENSQKRKVMNCCFLFAKENGPTEKFRTQLWQGFITVYGPDSEIGSVKQAAILFMDSCLTFFEEKKPEENECIDAMDMCLGFLHKAWNLVDTTEGKDPITDAEFGYLKQDFIYNSLSCVRADNFIPILEKFVLNNHLWVWNAKYKEQFFLKFRNIILNFDSYIKFAQTLLRFNQILHSTDQCDVVSWLMVKCLLRMNRLSFSSTHKVMYWLIHMPSSTQRFIASEFEKELKAHFSKFGTLEIKDFPSISWEIFGFTESDCNWAKKWVDLLQKFSLFFSTLTHGSKPELMDGIQNYFVFFIFNAVEDKKISELGIILKGLRTIGDTVGSYPTRLGSRDNVITLSNYLSNRLEVGTEEDEDHFRKEYAEGLKMDLTWEDEVVNSFVELSDISKETANELIDILAGWVEMIFLGEQKKRELLPVHLKAFNAEGIMRSIFLQAGNQARNKDISINFYRYALSTVDKKVYFTEEDFQRILEGIEHEDFPLQDTLELYKTARANLFLLEKDLNALTRALLNKFSSTHELYSEEDFNYIWDLLVNDQRIKSYNEAERGLYIRYLQSLNEQMEKMFTKVFLMKDTLTLCKVQKYEHEIGLHLAKLDKLSKALEHSRSVDLIEKARDELSAHEVMFDFNEYFMSGNRARLEDWKKIVGKLTNGIDLDQKYLLNWVKIYHLEIKRLIEIFGQKEWLFSHHKKPHHLSPSMGRVLKLNQSQSSAKALIMLLEYAIYFIVDHVMERIQTFKDENNQLFEKESQIYKDAKEKASQASDDVSTYFKSTVPNPASAFD